METIVCGIVKTYHLVAPVQLKVSVTWFQKKTPMLNVCV